MGFSSDSPAAMNLERLMRWNDGVCSAERNVFRQNEHGRRSGGGGSKTSVPSSSSSTVTVRPFFRHERRFLEGVVGGDGSSRELNNVTCVVGEFWGLYPNRRANSLS